MNLFSDAGGAFARRRRDVPKLLQFSCLSSASRKLFVPFCHSPDHHSASFLLSVLVVRDPLFRLPRTSSPIWSSNLLDTLDETYPVVLLARCLKAKSAKMVDLELNLSPAPRSMKPSCSATLIDQRSHWVLESLVPVTKLSTNGLTLIHQTNWYRCLSPLSPPVPHPSAVTLSTPIFCSPSSSRHTQSLIAHAKRKLGFSVLGLFQFGPSSSLSWQIHLFGPLRCLKPNSNRCDPNQFLQKSRFDQKSYLSIISQRWCRYLKPVFHGQQLEHIRSMLLCWYNYISRTLPFEAPREIFHKTKRVKKNGTMIPSPQSGDYRSFFNSSSPLPLIIELVHVQIIKFKDSSQIFKSLKKNGIITAFPWKSGYRSILNLFYPAASSLEFVSKSLYALFARAVYDHPLVEDFAKLVFLVESAIVSTNFSTIANFLKVNIPLENSWNLYLSFCCIIVACINFPLLRP
ncbi:unnamed protein product [Arabidopsis thaliana]|uniref:Uncharacterized protein n=1 Tax=Arabidopsis thaliana TaxID=3702 RepID=A0A5S9WI92_ARATH|nr:unnamed protein product [Arabidopsis thaliana]